MPTEPTRSLHRKLAQIMYEAERIPKNGTAPTAMGGFGFVQVGDAADYIRKALGEAVISMVPSAVEVVGQSEHASGADGKKTTTTVELRVTWTLTDGESGETAVIQSYGAGADNGDKYSGKAQTNAMKYALLMGFLLSTGDDPELSDTTDRQPRRTREEILRGIPAASTPEPVREPDPDNGLIGTVEVGTSSDSDFELRQTPDGYRLGFRLVSERGKIKVSASGMLAEELKTYQQDVVGQRVTCWGRVSEETFTPKPKPGAKEYTVKYLVLAAERVRVPGLGDLPLPVEAPTVPLFSPDIEAELAAAAMAR